MCFDDTIDWKDKYLDRDADVCQLLVQLAGCSLASFGCDTYHPCKQGDYGWSVAYSDVLDLRAKYEALLKENHELKVSNADIKNELTLINHDLKYVEKYIKK